MRSISSIYLNMWRLVEISKSEKSENIKISKMKSVSLKYEEQHLQRIF